MDYQLDLTHPELVFGVEAMYEAIDDRLEMGFSNDWAEWRSQVKIGAFQLTINNMTVLYQKLFALWSNTESIHTDWGESVTFSTKKWAMLDKVLLADSWDDLEPMSAEQFNELE